MIEVNGNNKNYSFVDDRKVYTVIAFHDMYTF